MYDYVYHYSKIKIDSVKTSNMLGNELDSRYAKENGDMVSFFLRDIPISKLLELKKTFVNYQTESLYLNKCSVLNNIGAWDKGVISLTSTPYLVRYDERHLKPYFRKYNIDYDKLNGDDKYWDDNKEEFTRLIAIYKEEREAALAKYQIIPVDDYQDNKYIREYIERYNYHIDYNIKHGNKNQYATYIPHIHTLVNEPIEVIESIKIW